ncbi:site-specific DNA-methyltransferase [Aeromonas hydrophila]
MEKLKMHSPNLVAQNIEQLAALFPNCVTESHGKDGELKRAIDFDLLKQELSAHIVDGPQERYQLNWPGKREALLTANAPIAKTLRPCREESVNFDTTQNLFIEGDNLDALKLLQETYLGKVKMIYIDPPYNTGGDFVYKDNFSESSGEYIARSNQVDNFGNRLVANLESNGRFHSDWLSMIYSRVKLSKRLLSNDGVLFVSIDDHEKDSLKKVLDEIYGEDSFVASIIWRKKASPDARATIGSVHDYLLCYVNDPQSPKSAIGKMSLSEKRKASFSNPDSDSRGPWASVDMTGMTGRATKDQYFKVTLPSGRIIAPPSGRSWGLVERTYQELLVDNRIWFGASGDNVPRIKRFMSEVDGQTVPTYWGYDEVGSNEDASDELLSLFGYPKLFDTPKPTKLIERLLEISTSSQGEHVVLDFFAGSSTTAHSVLNANAKDGGNRRFIMVQVGEPVNEKLEAYKLGYKIISDVSKVRIKKAGERILNHEFHNLWNKDIGFRVLKIDTSNMTDVYYNPDAIIQDDLFAQVDNIKADRTEEDLLFQVMLDWGVDLMAPILRQTIDGKSVFFVDADAEHKHGALVACFDKTGGIDDAFIRQLATFSPLRLVFRDAGFASDAVKINAEQLLKQLSPLTEVKAI